MMELCKFVLDALKQPQCYFLLWPFLGGRKRRNVDNCHIVFNGRSFDFKRIDYSFFYLVVQDYRNHDHCFALAQAPLSLASGISSCSTVVLRDWLKNFHCAEPTHSRNALLHIKVLQFLVHFVVHSSFRCLWSRPNWKCEGPDQTV